MWNDHRLIRWLSFLLLPLSLSLSLSLCASSTFVYEFRWSRDLFACDDDGKRRDSGSGKSESARARARIECVKNENKIWIGDDQLIKSWSRVDGRVRIKKHQHTVSLVNHNFNSVLGSQVCVCKVWSPHCGYMNDDDILLYIYIYTYIHCISINQIWIPFWSDRILPLLFRTWVDEMLQDSLWKSTLDVREEQDKQVRKGQASRREEEEHGWKVMMRREEPKARWRRKEKWFESIASI